MTPIRSYLNKLTRVLAKRAAQSLARFAREAEGHRPAPALRPERQTSADAATRADAFRAAVRSLDSSVVARAAVGWLRDDWACDNVIWMAKGALATELTYFDGGRNPRAFAHGRTRGLVHAAVPVLDGGLARLFARWAEGLPQAEPETPGMLAPRAAGPEGRSDLLITIASPDPSAGIEILGHVLLVGCPEWDRVSEAELFRAQLAALADRMDQALAHEALRALTYKDELTDLYNQRYLPLVLDEQVRRAQAANLEACAKGQTGGQSSGQSSGETGGENAAEGRFSVLFIDVDRFKSVNDNNGHLVGSRILVELSRVLQRAVRRTDFAFRYGGDEYVVVLPGADAQGAFIAAERIRRLAEASSFVLDPSERLDLDEHDARPLRVTVSIGVATFPEHAKSTRELLRIADEAMYASKRQSRNAVRLAS